MAYSDFKSYIQDKYCDVLTEAIQAFVNTHHDGIGFHGINVLSIAEQKVENVEVKSLVCHEDGIGDLLRMEVRTAADIVEMSLGTKAIEASRKTRWFIVHMTAELRHGLHDVKVFRTEENYYGEFDPHRLVLRLRRVDPLTIYREGKAMGVNMPASQKYLYQVFRIYNGSSKVHSLPLKF